MDAYIESAAKEILAGRLDYRELLRFAREFHYQRRSLNSKYDLSNLYLLHYAIEEFAAGDQGWTYYYEGLDTTNPARSVERECRILLGMEKPETNPRFLDRGKSLARSPDIDGADAGNRIARLAIEPACRPASLWAVVASLLAMGFLMAMRWRLNH